MKSLIFAALVASLMTCVPASAGAQGTIAKVHTDGKDKLVVESGGEIEFKSGSTLTVPDGTVDTDKIAADAVTTEKIADGAVTAAKIGTGAVTADKVGSGAINTTTVEAVVTPATGTLLCYTNDGKIGKVTAVVETGKTGTCAAF